MNSTSTNTNCDQHYGISILPCSGHGDCVNNICICYNGWTSVANGVQESGLDCDINITAIKVLGAIAFICAYGCLIYTIRFHCNRLPESPQYILRSRLINVITVNSILIIMFGTLKVVNPLVNVIAQSTFTTVVYLLIFFGQNLTLQLHFFISVKFFQNLIVNSANQSRLTIQQSYFYVKILVTIIWFVVISQLIFGCFSQIDSRDADTYLLVNCILMCFVSVLYAVLFFYVLRNARIELLRHLTFYDRQADEENDLACKQRLVNLPQRMTIERSCDNIYRKMIFVVANGVIFLAIHLVMSLSYYLRKKYSYVLLSLMVLSCIQNFGIINAISSTISSNNTVSPLFDIET